MSFFHRISKREKYKEKIKIVCNLNFVEIVSSGTSKFLS